jgi:hypothetical protein
VFYYYHCGDTYDGGVLVPEGIIHPCFITITGDTYDGGVLVPEGIIPRVLLLSREILMIAEY